MGSPRVLHGRTESIPKGYAIDHSMSTANSLVKCRQEKRRVEGGNFFLPGQAGHRAGKHKCGSPATVAGGMGRRRGRPIGDTHERGQRAA